MTTEQRVKKENEQRENPLTGKALWEAICAEICHEADARRRAEGWK